MEEALFYVQQIERELHCPLCEKPLANPHTVPGCGHTFCWDCVIDTLEGPGIVKSECPQCHQPAWKKDLQPCHKYSNLLEGLARLRQCLPEAPDGGPGAESDNEPGPGVEPSQDARPSPQQQRQAAGGSAAAADVGPGGMEQGSPPLGGQRRAAPAAPVLPADSAQDVPLGPADGGGGGHSGGLAGRDGSTGTQPPSTGPLSGPEALPNATHSGHRGSAGGQAVEPRQAGLPAVLQRPLPWEQVQGGNAAGAAADFRSLLTQLVQQQEQHALQQRAAAAAQGGHGFEQPAPQLPGDWAAALQRLPPPSAAQAAALHAELAAVEQQLGDVEAALAAEAGGGAAATGAVAAEVGRPAWRAGALPRGGGIVPASPVLDVAAIDAAMRARGYQLSQRGGEGGAPPPAQQPLQPAPQQDSAGGPAGVPGPLRVLQPLQANTVQAQRRVLQAPASGEQARTAECKAAKAAGRQADAGDGQAPPAEGAPRGAASQPQWRELPPGKRRRTFSLGGGRQGSGGGSQGSGASRSAGGGVRAAAAAHAEGPPLVAAAVAAAPGLGQAEWAGGAAMANAAAAPAAGGMLAAAQPDAAAADGSSSGQKPQRTKQQPRRRAGKGPNGGSGPSDGHADAPPSQQQPSRKRPGSQAAAAASAQAATALARRQSQRLQKAAAQPAAGPSVAPPSAPPPRRSKRTAAMALEPQQGPAAGGLPILNLNAATAKDRRKLAKQLVGCRIAVLWPQDGECYPATVGHYHTRSKCHRIDYDDGEQEQLDLDKQVWHLLCEGADAKAPQGVGGAAAAPVACSGSGGESGGNSGSGGGTSSGCSDAAASSNDASGGNGSGDTHGPSGGSRGSGSQGAGGSGGAGSERAEAGVQQGRSGQQGPSPQRQAVGRQGRAPPAPAALVHQGPAVTCSKVFGRGVLKHPPAATTGALAAQHAAAAAIAAPPTQACGQLGPQQPAAGAGAGEGGDAPQPGLLAHMPRVLVLNCPNAQLGSERVRRVRALVAAVPGGPQAIHHHMGDDCQGLDCWVLMDGAGERRIAHRTLKYLRALVRGHPLVEWAWAEACITAGAWLPAEPYMLWGAAGKHTLAARWSLARLHKMGAPPLFSGLHVLVPGSDLKPRQANGPKDAQEAAVATLLRDGGAEVDTAPLPQSAAGVAALRERLAGLGDGVWVVLPADASADDGAAARALAGGRPPMVAKWVFDCVEAVSVLDTAELRWRAAAPPAGAAG